MVMSFGPNTLTIVGHFILIWALFRLALAGVRLHRFQGHRSRSITLHDLAMSCILFPFTLALERSYYIVARLIKPTGVNLWDRHPAPELLSVFVAIGIYGLMVNVEMLTAENRAHTFRARAKELSAVIACFASLSIIGG